MTRLALAAVICLCFSAHPAAQRKAGATEALRLLGEFAVNLLSNLASDYGSRMLASNTPSPVAPSRTSTAASAPQGLNGANPAPPAPAPVPYKFTVMWQMPGDPIVYHGTLKMQGMTGRLRVVLYQNGRKEGVIDQQVTAVPIRKGSLRGNILLKSAFPVRAGTRTPADNYDPDHFLLERSTSGYWGIRTMVSSGRVAPVTVIEAVQGPKAK